MYQTASSRMKSTKNYKVVLKLSKKSQNEPHLLTSEHLEQKKL